MHRFSSCWQSRAGGILASPHHMSPLLTTPSREVSSPVNVDSECGDRDHDPDSSWQRD